MLMLMVFTATSITLPTSALSRPLSNALLMGPMAENVTHARYHDSLARRTRGAAVHRGRRPGSRPRRGAHSYSGGWGQPRRPDAASGVLSSAAWRSAVPRARVRRADRGAG